MISEYVGLILQTSCQRYSSFTAGRSFANATRSTLAIGTACATPYTTNCKKLLIFFCRRLKLSIRTLPGVEHLQVSPCDEAVGHLIQLAAHLQSSPHVHPPRQKVRTVCNKVKI
jgi:phosphatidylserine decarboxylase